MPRAATSTSVQHASTNAETLAGRRVLMYQDNATALHAMVSGSSSSRAVWQAVTEKEAETEVETEKEAGSPFVKGFSTAAGGASVDLGVALGRLLP